MVAFVKMLGQIVPLSEYTPLLHYETEVNRLKSSGKFVCLVIMM